MHKIKPTLFFLLLFSLKTFSQQIDNSGTSSSVLGGSIGLGSIIAVTISWDRNKSILYAIIHGILGWLYVIYFAIVDLTEKKE